MEVVKNFCLVYTKQDIQNLSKDSLNRNFYVIGLPNQEEIYLCKTRRANGYREISRIKFGKRSLSDIDNYTLKNFYNEQDFFECLGLSSEVFLSPAERHSIDFRKLFVAQVNKNGWVDKLPPLFSNTELEKKLSDSCVDLQLDYIYDPDFVSTFYAMVSDTDRSYYDFLTKTIANDKDELYDLASRIRFVERRDVKCNDKYVMTNPLIKSEFVMNSARRHLLNYPFYRKAFLSVQDFSTEKPTTTGAKPNYSEEQIDAYQEITGIAKTKR